MAIFSIIVAASKNNAIGLHGNLPWKKLPADLKYFKNKTLDHWCILGRKTYNSLGNKLLHGRKFIIVTRDKNFSSADSLVVHTLEDALSRKEIQKEKEVFILGGGEIFKEIINKAHRIYLTRIYENFEGDTFFPELDMSKWNILSKEAHEADEKNPYDYTFLVYDRK